MTCTALDVVLSLTCVLITSVKVLLLLSSKLVYVFSSDFGHRDLRPLTLAQDLRKGDSETYTKDSDGEIAYNSVSVAAEFFVDMAQSLRLVPTLC